MRNTLYLAALRATAEAKAQELDSLLSQRSNVNGQSAAVGFTDIPMVQIAPPTCLTLIARAEQVDALEAERDAAQQRAEKAERELALMQDANTAYSMGKSFMRGQYQEIMAQTEAERERLKARASAMTEALVLCADTLEGHLDEPQAVSHGECREAAKVARAALAAQEAK